jgi:lauroyl/myristoyl acyltransferase
MDKPGQGQNGEGSRRKKSAVVSWFTRLKYNVVRTCLMALVKAVGLDGLYRFGQAFGYCEFLLQYKRRASAYKRLEQIFGEPLPPARRRMIIRRQVCRIRCDKMLYTIMDLIDRDELTKRFLITGKEHMDRAVEHNRGVFFMFSHTGSHHLGGIFLVLLGYPVIGLRDPNESPLRLYIQQQFERNFPQFKDLQITPNDSFARTFFKAFHDKSIVAAAMDAWRDRENVRTVKVNIFGQEREFLSGMTHIALRSRAVILIGFLLALPGYRYHLIFHPWLSDPEADQDTPETVFRVMQEYAHAIEDHVKRYPCNISKIH